MIHAIKIHKTGGPEVLSWEEYDPGTPEPGEVRIIHEAIGLNFIDVYHRTGLYPLPVLPVVPGLEGAGRVDSVGSGVTAAMMLQGMTARYLLKGCFNVKQGTTFLIHAASGGVGSILCQWARHIGATTIGTVGSAEKAELARRNGCAHTILYQQQDFAAAVKDITQGRGVDVVYDSVGQATFMKSLDCLHPMGVMVSFGQSSGPVAPLDISLLGGKGSLFLTRPSLMHYTAAREALLAHARDLFDVVVSGAVKINIMQEYALKDAAQAHRDLEGRKTKGNSILLP